MKKTLLCLILIISILLTVLSSCMPKEDWRNKGYDISLPVLGENGWYEVIFDDFEYLNTELWTPSPHGLRWQTQTGKDIHSNYWCDDMVRVEGGNLIITSYQTDNHNCSKGVCPSLGRFSGGLETRKVINDTNDNAKGTHDELLFGQAFGYFETRVKFPDSNGLWSAFWLQSSNQRKVGNNGLDGTEIDVFESAFRKASGNKMGHALLWDGYGKDSKVADYILDLGYDLYEGYHTYALKWTPLYYVFYIDGIPTWATDAGGVSRVKQFLRFTVEIDAGDKYGPHGMKIGTLKEGEKPEFIVDYVKVYQNSNYLKYILDDSCFPGSLDFDN